MAAPEAATASVLVGESGRRVLVTPEGVDLGVRVGEAGERAAAFVIDVAIILAGMILLTVICFATAVAGKGHGLQLIAVIWLLGGFFARNLYFMGFELGARGATPGKRLMKLRVAARHGGRLTADAIFARNAMRELEVYLPLSFLVSQAEPVGAALNLLGIAWSAVFVFFPLFNRDRLRVGDLVAGTWVLKAPRTRLLPDLAAQAAPVRARYEFTPAQIDAYGIKELQVLEDVLRAGEPKTIKAVAERIRRKIAWTAGQDERDREFLDAYYAGLRQRLEMRLLFGRRRKDKHDLG